MAGIWEKSKNWTPWKKNWQLTIGGFSFRWMVVFKFALFSIIPKHQSIMIFLILFLLSYTSWWPSCQSPPAALVPCQEEAPLVGIDGWAHIEHIKRPWLLSTHIGISAIHIRNPNQIFSKKTAIKPWKRARNILTRGRALSAYIGILVIHTDNNRPSVL